MKEYHNPYFDQTFWGFFVQLILRLWGFLTGDLHYSDLTSDEIQIVVLLGVAISSASVGSFLVLRKLTMLANSLSHTILLGIVLAYLFTKEGLSSEPEGKHVHFLNIQAMLFAALGMGFVTAFLTEFLTKVVRLQEDASTGLVFTSLFAMGIVGVTILTRDAHIGTEVVMGNVDALHLDDCQLIFLIVLINLVLFTLFFKEFKITTFDAGLAVALGFSPVFFNYLLMAQVSITAVGAFRAVGVLMVLAFLTAPVLSARLLTHDLKTMIFLAIAIGCSASAIGVALSRHVLTVYGMPLSTGGLVVCVLIALYLFVIITAPTQGLIAKWRRRVVSPPSRENV